MARRVEVDRARKFLSGSVKSESVIDSDKHMLVIMGDEFRMFAIHDRILLAAHPVGQKPDLSMPREKPLSKDMLRNMSADFNMVVGTVLGATGTSIDATEFKIEIRDYA